MNLSRKERLILANQFKILEKLYPQEAEHYAVQRKAVEHGYALEYEALAAHLYDEMPVKDCREVLDILNMYRAMTFSNSQLNEDDKIDPKKLKFPGFDGNNETNQMGYTMYFINDLGRFEELRDNSPYADYNSHTEKLPTYRKMLLTWKKYDMRHKLTKDEILSILS